MQRENGVVRGMIGVVTGWAVNDFSAFAQGEVIGDRNRFIVSHEEAILRPRCRRPRPYPRVGAGPRDVDCRTAPRLVLLAAKWQFFFMCAPAKLGWLQAFRDETLDRPGVDESIKRLWFF